jgi:hypothetical protein
MFGAFDIAFCTNRDCPKSDTCGRSVKRLDGKKAVISMSFFEIDDNGFCEFEKPYMEYEVPEWMTKMVEEEEANEMARRKELADSGSLDSDVGL